MNAGYFPIMIYRVAERSMEPALKPGDYILVSSLGRNFRPGDIVVLRRHPSERMVLVKRISRIEGGKAFLVGDNLEESVDSRHFGSVSASRIIGKVIFRI